MSGSSGYSFDTGTSTIKCEDLVIRTQLASPNPTVVAGLSAGEILTIHLVNALGPIQAMTGEGAIAGAILTSKATQLINCIASGTVYVAKVISVNGGDCQITIFCPKQ